MILRRRLKLEFRISLNLPNLRMINITSNELIGELPSKLSFKIKNVNKKTNQILHRINMRIMHDSSDALVNTNRKVDIATEVLREKSTRKDSYPGLFSEGIPCG